MLALAAGLMVMPVPGLTAPDGGLAENYSGEIKTEGFLGLGDAIEIALSNNPGLQEIAARVRAAGAVPSQVGSLPDPMLTFSAMNLPTDTFNLDQEPMTQMRVGLSQALPFPGKLRLKKEAAEYDAEVLSHSYEGARLILIRDITKEWWTAFYVKMALQIVDRNLDLLRSFVDIAGEKYAVGKGLQSDVVLAQLELSKLLDLQIRLTDAMAASAAKIRAYLALPAGTPIRMPEGVTINFGALPDQAELLEEAEQSSPVLAMEKSRIDAADTRKKLAKREFYPDFKISADYGFRSGFDPVRNTDRADFASIGIGVSIPLYSGKKQSKALEQRREELQGSMLGLARSRLLVEQTISIGLSSYNRALSQLSLFETGIIPEARQAVEAMRASYLTGEVDFLNLVSAEITLYNFETRYWQVVAEAHQALAEIEAVIGKEIQK